MMVFSPRLRTLLRRALTVVALMACASALFATLWIVLPAPHYNVWLLSVVASEWSLWFAAAALFGVACALAAWRSGGSRGVNLCAVACGLFAIACSLVPPASALRVAQERDTPLSLREYLFGAAARASNDGFTTHTFATLEGEALQLDAYAPPESVGRNGAGFIVVHGGSWNGGERSDFPAWSFWLAREGFVVFDIDYRLAPQPNWLEATGDVKCAVLWVKAHAAEFRIDPQRLALLGRSAGGHLALLAAYTADDARLPSSCQEEANVHDASVRAVISFYAPTDLLWAYDNPANRFVIDGPLTLRRFLGASPDASDEMRARFRLASPVAHVSAPTPPTLLIHGGRDQLVREENMMLLAHELRRTGVAHETLSVPYAQHGFDYNFKGWGAQLTRSAMRDFLRTNLDLPR